jgi:hypothetical protein
VRNGLLLHHSAERRSRRSDCGLRERDVDILQLQHVSLDVLVGSGGHDFAEFEAAGHRVTAATLEPATLTVGAIGLLGAALLRRQRQASSPLPHDA